MIVDILPFRLQLASLQKGDIPRCTHQLMKLVLFPSGPQHFFSYTETDQEVSLILDQSHLAGFPENALNVCSVIWRAVQIEPGECGFDTVEVISQVSRPLAEINVSIMQISTYDADFTLMPECDVKRALECLSEKFTISNNPLEDLGLQDGDLRSWEKSSGPGSLQEAHLLNSVSTIPRERRASLDADSGIASASPSGPSSLTTNGHCMNVSDLQLELPLISTLSLNGHEPTSQSPNRERTKKARHTFNADFSHRLHITSMEESLVDTLAIRLLESIFFDNRTDRFFSFTQTNTTLSIIMDDATMSLFPDHTLNTHAGDWRLIAIGDGPLGFDECGIVSEFSRPLCENGIGLFYLSTFSSDYIMVNDQDFEQAVECLVRTAKVTRSAEGTPPDSARDTLQSQPSDEQGENHGRNEEGEEEKEDDEDSRSVHSESMPEGEQADTAKHGEDVEVVFAYDGPPSGQSHG